MIQKMKKLTFLVYHREYDEFLHCLQELGVMHIEAGALSGEQSEAVSEDVSELRRVEALQQKISLLLEKVKKEKSSSASDSASVGLADGAPSLDLPTLEDAFATEATLSSREKELTGQIAALTPWGDFDPVDVRQQLAKADCEMHFFTAPLKDYKREIAPYYITELISEQKGLAYFVVITRGEEQPNFAATPVSLPEVSLSSLTAELEQNREDYAAIISQLQQLSTAQSAALEAYREELQTRMNFDTVRAGTEAAADNHLMVLRGWIPADKQEEVKTAFSETGAWFDISDPQPEDDIPVCLKNNRFFSLFEMITELYMLPKYNELDLTPFFAPFYILFFGLCLGDSGYGLFITVCVLAAKHSMKMGKSMRAAMNLLLTMGLSAFFCGLLSGAFFGFNLYNLGVPFFDKIGNVIALDNSQMFNLSLILGFIQIIFGMCLKAYNRTIQFGFSYSLSTIGWMMIILSLAASMFMPEYSSIAQWFTIVGFVLALGYNSPDRYKKNIFTGFLINLGSGLWDAYNTATGMLGDMLSYVRLFALGLSGGILATVFDSLATGLAPDNAILGPIVMVLIFVIGHALNMFMNVLGAFVHPMRLTFVEFFKNAGYEGGGSAYTPFK